MLWYFPEIGMGVAYHDESDISLNKGLYNGIEMYFERDISSVHNEDEDGMTNLLKDIEPNPIIPKDTQKLFNLESNNQNHYRDAASDPLDRSDVDENFMRSDTSNNGSTQFDYGQINLKYPEDKNDNTIIDTENINWGIDRINARKTTYTGDDINIGILDTGIDEFHPDFTDTNVRKFSLFKNEPASDNHGHGTHCASIAAGKNGVATQANLIVGKVLNDNGEGKELDFILGIFSCLMKGAHVISFSIKLKNGPGGLSRDPFDKIIKIAAVKYNCPVVCAAGNDSSRIGNYNAICSPADSQYALAIGAIDNNDSIYLKSNRASTRLLQQMNYAAPGVDISAAKPLNVGNPKKLYQKMSGTSMAAPFITGSIALIIEKRLKTFKHYRAQALSFRGIIGDLNQHLYKNDKWNALDYGNGIPNLLNL